MKESDLQKKGVTYLHSLNSYTFKVIQANKSGVPDVVACVPMTKSQIMSLDKEVIGVFVAVEFKNPNKKGVTSPIQLRNLKQIKKAGGIGLVIDDLAELKCLVRK